MELRKALEKKKRELTELFNKNRNQAQVFMKQKIVVDEQLKKLVASGSMIVAKMNAIDEMLEE